MRENWCSVSSNMWVFYFKSSSDKGYHWFEKKFKIQKKIFLSHFRNFFSISILSVITVITYHLITDKKYQFISVQANYLNSYHLITYQEASMKSWNGPETKGFEVVFEGVKRGVPTVSGVIGQIFITQDGDFEALITGYVVKSKFYQFINNQCLSQTVFAQSSPLSRWLRPRISHLKSTTASRPCPSPSRLLSPSDTFWLFRTVVIEFWRFWVEKRRRDWRRWTRQSRIQSLVSRSTGLSGRISSRG